MRIEKLDENTKKDLLETLIKRAPNSYGKYEDSVREILDTVKEEIRLSLNIQKNSTAHRSMPIIFL